MLSLDDLLPKEPVQPISYDTLIILLGKKHHFLLNHINKIKFVIFRSTVEFLVVYFRFYNYYNVKHFLIAEDVNKKMINMKYYLAQDLR